MKLNLYAKGQCTYYVFDRIRQDSNMISNRWGDAKYWANEATKKDIKLMIIKCWFNSSISKRSTWSCCICEQS